MPFDPALQRKLDALWSTRLTVAVVSALLARTIPITMCLGSEGKGSRRFNTED